MNAEQVKIAKQIEAEQVRIISRPSFRGYFDKVLYRLLRKYDMSLDEYYACLEVMAK